MNFKKLFENKLFQFLLFVLLMLVILGKFPIGFIPSVFWAQLAYYPSLIMSYVVAAVCTIGSYYFFFVQYPKIVRSKFIGPFQPYVLPTTDKFGVGAFLFFPLLLGPILGFLFYFIPMQLFPFALTTLSFSKTEMIFVVKSRKTNGKRCSRGVKIQQLHGFEICNIPKNTYGKMGRGTEFKINGYGGKFGVFYTDFEILSDN